MYHIISVVSSVTHAGCGCAVMRSYQFFLQAKRDIAEGRLPVDSPLAAELAAYAVQCKIIAPLCPCSRYLVHCSVTVYHI